MQQRTVRHHRIVSSLATLAMLVSLVYVGMPAAQAVNVAQNQIVNPNPANFTPNVLNGQINSIVQIGTRSTPVCQFTQVQAASGGTIFSAVEPVRVRRDDRRDRHDLRPHVRFTPW